MKQYRGYQNNKKARAIALERYPQIMAADDQYGETDEMLPFIFLMVVGIFVVSCVVFKDQLLSLIL